MLHMDTEGVFTFLRKLEKNNSKEWMDDNRASYLEARGVMISLAGEILRRLARTNARYEQLDPKKTIKRINNNRMFHPSKPIYKDNFSFSAEAMHEPSLYLHLSPNGSFIGGGLYHPDSPSLKKIRAAIDYDGEELLEIVNGKNFKTTFGGLSIDKEALKTNPRGYPKDHRHIHLLRRKNFTAIHGLSEEQINSKDFLDLIEHSFTTLIPFNAYLNKAINF